MLESSLALLTGVFGVLMSVSHFPQAYRLYKTKSSKDLSLVMYSVFTLGSYVWLAYGMVSGAWPIIASFSVAVVGTTLVLVMAIRYRRSS